MRPASAVRVQDSLLDLKICISINSYEPFPVFERHTSGLVISPHFSPAFYCDRGCRLNLKALACDPTSTYFNRPSSGSLRQSPHLQAPARSRDEVGEKCRLGDRFLPMQTIHSK